MEGQPYDRLLRAGLDEAGMDFGGGRVLHCCIPNAALAARDFSRVRANLQFACRLQTHDTPCKLWYNYGSTAVTGQKGVARARWNREC